MSIFVFRGREIKKLLKVAVLRALGKDFPYPQLLEQEIDRNFVLLSDKKISFPEFVKSVVDDVKILVQRHGSR